MKQEMPTKEKVRRLANMQRTITYAFEQVTMGSDNWRINNNLRSMVEDVKRYMEENPDEEVGTQK